MRIPSVLTEATIEKLLSKQYGIEKIKKIKKVMFGNSSHCYRIVTVDGPTYFLKESSPSFTFQELLAEAAVLDVLDASHLPVGPFIKTKAGEQVLAYKGRPVHLHPFIDGTVFAQFTAPVWLQEQSAKMLGKIHTSLIDLEVPTRRFDQSWFENRKNPENGLRKYDNLLKKIARLNGSRLKEELVAELEYKQSQVKKAATLALNPEMFTYGVTHGDYNVEQILTTDEVVVGVTDFERVTHMPLAWEVLRSYSLADPACETGVMDADNLKRYVSWYLESHTLSKEDLKQVLYLSYMHIANSIHGYKEFVDDSVINPRPMLEYGRWYTRQLAWLETNMEKLSEELSNLAQ
jgi:Ser/Thr protein kinase RdoA (MazF antagonist)